MSSIFLFNNENLKSSDREFLSTTLFDLEPNVSSAPRFLDGLGESYCWMKPKESSLFYFDPILLLEFDLLKCGVIVP